MHECRYVRPYQGLQRPCKFDRSIHPQSALSPIVPYRGLPIHLVIRPPADPR